MHVIYCYLRQQSSGLTQLKFIRSFVHTTTTMIIATNTEVNIEVKVIITLSFEVLSH